MAKHGTLTDAGLAALCSDIKSNRETAENAGNAVTRLSELTQQGFKEMSDAINDFPRVTAFSIPAAAGEAAWIFDENETSDYKWHVDIAVEGVTAYDLAIVTIERGSLFVANRCGFCPQNMTLEGKIRLFAKSVPPMSIAAEYYVCPGKEPDEPETTEGE